MLQVRIRLYLHCIVITLKSDLKWSLLKRLQGNSKDCNIFIVVIIAYFNVMLQWKNYQNNQLTVIKYAKPAFIRIISSNKRLEN